jgi:hypothetical protein
MGLSMCGRYLEYGGEHKLIPLIFEGFKGNNAKIG